MATSVCVCQSCRSKFEARRNDAKWCPNCRAWKHKEYEQVTETRLQKHCPDCGLLCNRRAQRCHACDNKKRRQRRGSLSPTWKGGRHRRKCDGYIEVTIDGHRILEHRYVWEQANGPLPAGHVVHHLNGFRDDNRLENLVGMARSHHGPRAHIDPTFYEARIRILEARIRELEQIR